MNKILMLIGIILSLHFVASAEAIDQTGLLGKSEKVDDAQLKMLLIPSMKHDVHVIVSDDRSRICICDDFSVLREEIKTGEARAFFLNKDLKIESLLINGKSNELYLFENVRAEHFQPRLRLLSLIDVSQFSQVFSTNIPDVSALPDTVHFKLKYSLAISDTLKYTDYINGVINARGQNFWYARNIHRDEEVNLSISAPISYDVEVGERKLVPKIVSNRKEFTYRFMDSNNNPQNLKLIKKLN